MSLFGAGLMALRTDRTGLLERLADLGPRGGARWRCTAHFSGRTALAAVARALVASGRPRVALLPAYLCNVVEMAFVREGFEVRHYEVDEAFHPDTAALMRVAAEQDAGVLLLAPLYGSDGGLAAWTSEVAADLRRERGLALVLDLCQDAGWLQALTAPLTDAAVVVSFNDKSFPGAMGAAVWSDLAVHEPPEPARRIGRALVRWRLRVFAAACWRRLKRCRAAAAGRAAGYDEMVPAAFEFSRATAFPHAFDVEGATRWQIALGIVGLVRLPQWQARRAAALQRGTVRAAGPSAGSTSPFVLVRDDDPGSHRAKPPYACAGDARASLRPTIRVRHNKGFDDR